MKEQELQEVLKFPIEIFWSLESRGLFLRRGFVPEPSSFAVKSLGLGVRELKIKSLGFGVCGISHPCHKPPPPDIRLCVAPGTVNTAMWVRGVNN